MTLGQTQDNASIEVPNGIRTLTLAAEQALRIVGQPVGEMLWGLIALVIHITIGLNNIDKVSTKVFSLGSLIYFQDIFICVIERKMSYEEGQVISCHSIDEWKEHFQKGLESKKLVVVDFTASGCMPCLFIGQILVEIAKKTPHVIFLKVDVDELKTVAEEYNVDAMPTFVFLKEGKQVDEVVGAKKEDLQAKITELGTITA
ncbi:hypothetical protein RD792_005519 [Penstemon davidsonii]|uniref:Thioredoxin domain-containing protein n=1 Tax=Penstemon davidsonii TaxID=160366 RepID=A0ABR0DGE5_9LAMI|nr:hypothetical protein RD792_005519 [Penstemon davidsonii]